jgi:hypothetical protein
MSTTKGKEMLTQRDLDFGDIDERSESPGTYWAPLGTGVILYRSFVEGHYIVRVKVVGEHAIKRVFDNYDDAKTFQSDYWERVNRWLSNSSQARVF